MTADELFQLAEKNETQTLSSGEVRDLLAYVDSLNADLIKMSAELHDVREDAKTESGFYALYDLYTATREAANRKDAKLLVAADLLFELRGVLLKLVPWVDYPTPPKLIEEMHAALGKVPGDLPEP